MVTLVQIQCPSQYVNQALLLNSIFFSFLSPQLKVSVHLSMLIKLCCLIPFFFFFVSPVQSQCPSQYINQALLLNSFFKSLICISCCPSSEVCITLAFPSRPLAYFLIPSYSLRTRTIKLALSSISLEGLGYPESTV